MTRDDTHETAIRTRGLTKRFGDVVAVDRLDLRVERGEVFGFLGPNGAGKSTVIDLLLDFVRPTAGSASVFGLDPRTDAERVRRRTGVLPEGASLYDRLTGREHLEWVARANGVEIETADPDAILERVGLSIDDGDRPVGGYSKGMAQRLAFGMALVGEPDLLLLDEPSSGLDPRGARRFREIVRTEAENGRTVFFSSHVLGEVEAVCDRIGILNDGRLEAVGTPSALRSALDVGGSITLAVERASGGHDNGIVRDRDLESELAALDGVDSVTVSTPDARSNGTAGEPATVTATLADPTAKVDVVTRVDERMRVLDVVSRDAPLERVFDAYTSASSAPGGRAETAVADDDADSPLLEVDS